MTTPVTGLAIEIPGMDCANNLMDAVVIGMKNRKEIVEAIMHINNAFAD